MGLCGHNYEYNSILFAFIFTHAIRSKIDDVNYLANHILRRFGKFGFLSAFKNTLAAEMFCLKPSESLQMNSYKI